MILPDFFASSQLGGVAPPARYVTGAIVQTGLHHLHRADKRRTMQTKILAVPCPKRSSVKRVITYNEDKLKMLYTYFDLLFPFIV